MARCQWSGPHQDGNIGDGWQVEREAALEAIAAERAVAASCTAAAEERGRSLDAQVHRSPPPCPALGPRPVGCNCQWQESSTPADGRT